MKTYSEFTQNISEDAIETGRAFTENDKRQIANWAKNIEGQRVLFHGSVKSFDNLDPKRRKYNEMGFHFAQDPLITADFMSKSGRGYIYAYDVKDAKFFRVGFDIDSDPITWVRELIKQHPKRIDKEKLKKLKKLYRKANYTWTGSSAEIEALSEFLQQMFKDSGYAGFKYRNRIEGLGSGAETTMSYMLFDYALEEAEMVGVLKVEYVEGTQPKSKSDKAAQTKKSFWRFLPWVK